MILRSILPEGTVTDDLDTITEWYSAFGRRLFVIHSDTDSLILPVTPWKYGVTTGQINKTYDIIDFGEALIFGNAKLAKLKFEAWFPAITHKYPYITNVIEPSVCVEKFVNLKEGKNPVRIIITGSPINAAVAVSEFDYREKDGTGDIYANVTMVEYRDLNVPAANNPREIDVLTGLRGRPEVEHSRYSSVSWISRHSNDKVERFKFETGGCYGFSP